MKTPVLTANNFVAADILSSQPLYMPPTLGQTAPETQKARIMDVPALDLPFDGRSDRTFSWEQVALLDFEIPPQAESLLRAYVNQHGFTEAAIYFSVFALLLSRYANAAEIPVSLPGESGVAATHSTRSAVLMADCAPKQTFQTCLHCVQAFIHNGHGISQSEHGGAIPGFASFWVESDSPAGNTGCLEVGRLHLKAALPNATPFDIALRLRILQGRVRSSLLYRQDRFSPESVQRMSRHFLRLFEECLAKPDAALAEFDMVTVEERAFLLAASHSEESAFPALCLHQLFAEQAAIRPESLAVVFGDARLSYRELDRKSNRIARLLRAESIQLEDRIGIFMEPSADMIAAILGILKAGGVYVPIDPAYPEERLRFLAEDTGLHAVLTHTLVTAKLPTAAPMICIDGPDSPVEQHSSEPVPNWSTPESIAALIYTSGSTGRPKGACIPHRAAVRTVRNTNYISASASDRVGQACSVSFDAAIKEIWLALTNGAALVGVPRHTLLDPKQLQDLIDKEGISILILNTSYVNQIGRDAPEALSKLRKVMFGGEAADPGPLRLLVNHVAPGVLINGYGPAEGCVITTYHEIGSIPEDAVSVPIGRPVSNAQVYLLDAMRRPVPVGVPGEIYIGGQGVARGYWNRPELTKERFVPDTFSDRAGALLYRTGDLARLRSNGDFEFLGRIDEQVKIRGHRIELAEVRHAIAAHPAVEQVVLTVREDQPGDRRLVAYITLHHTLSKPEEALRLHTRSKLPPHMLPASFVVMESIPLNANGKVDRKALPPPDQRPESARSFEPARTDLERTLAKIWSELLRVDRIGIHDSFFDLGGHSLLAARLVARIEKELGRNIPVATLFEAPTIYHLARTLATSSCEDFWSPLVELRSQTSHIDLKPFFCVHSLGANLTSQHKIASLLESDRAVYGLQPHGLDGKQLPLQSIEAMADAYLQEIRKKQPAGPYFLGGVCLGGVIAYEMAQQLTAAGEHVALVALIDSFMPGDLTYLHQRPELMQYLDWHFGEMLLLPGLQGIKYVLRWMANGGVRLRNAVGFGNQSSLTRATRRVAEAHLKAIRNYCPQPYDGKVVQLMCSDGSFRSYEDRRLAWSSLLSAGFEVQIIPGNHLSMVEEPHVRVLAEELEVRLQRAGGETIGRHRSRRSLEASRPKPSSGCQITSASQRPGDFSAPVLHST
jgi:amino acid adenylation domain-containing protein